MQSIYYSWELNWEHYDQQKWKKEWFMLQIETNVQLTVLVLRTKNTPMKRDTFFFVSRIRAKCRCVEGTHQKRCIWKYSFAALRIHFLRRNYEAQLWSKRYIIFYWKAVDAQQQWWADDLLARNSRWNAEVASFLEPTCRKMVGNQSFCNWLASSTGIGPAA